MRRMLIETHFCPTLRTPKRRIRLARTPGTRSLSRTLTSDGNTSMYDRDQSKQKPYINFEFLCNMNDHIVDHGPGGKA